MDPRRQLSLFLCDLDAKIAKNRKKSHLVFVDVVDTQKIRRKNAKTHFPKIETTKNPRGHRHGKPPREKQLNNPMTKLSKRRNPEA